MKKHSPGFEWSYRDLLFTMMVAYMAMAAMALIITTKITQVNSVSPGNILVQLFWDKGADADVDLWVLAPDETPVGYSNRAGVVFNLLRDDLGTSLDSNSKNQELAVGRGLKEGEYTINIHLFSTRSAPPINCEITITLDKHTVGDNGKILGGGPVLMTKENIILERHGQEVTVIRFTLDKNGEIVPGSKNKIQKLLRTAEDRPEGPIGFAMPVPGATQ